MRALAVIALVAVSVLSGSTRASAATAPFLYLPLDGDPFISYYVYDAWTQRMGLPTYSNITLGVPYGQGFLLARPMPVNEIERFAAISI